MKEGYLQLKISELNDKCVQIDQMISMEKSKIQRLEEKVGGLKELIKKLNDLDEFKNNLLTQIQKSNKENISNEIKQLSNNVAKNIESLVNDKTREIEKILDYMKKREKETEQQTMIISDLKEKINYLLKHNEILMMKLVNKTILSDKEVDELDKRSSKKID
jgi:hypothetical protein